MTGGFYTSGKTSNGTPELCISIALASIQKLLPFSLSRLCPCLMLVGISIPYFWVVLKMCDFSADRITSLFRIMYGTHQANACSSAMTRALENSATSIGWDYFRYFKWIHDLDWSRHWTMSFHPTVVFQIFIWPRLVTMYMSPLVTAVAASFR